MEKLDEIVDCFKVLQENEFLLDGTFATPDECVHTCELIMHSGNGFCTPNVVLTANRNGP